MKISQRAKQAIMIGSLCSVSYFAVYIARNILGSVTPMMLEDGYSEEYISHISALYFGFYAFGQLINGAIGDRIRAKWMICIGLLGAGIANFVFSRVTPVPTAAMIAYGFTGLFLSMVYGPMTKVVAENTEPIHATRCSLGYTFASFFGSPAAGLLALVLSSWRGVFALSSGALVLMAVLGFIFFTRFERKGIIQYGNYKPQEKGVKSIGVLFRHQIVKFSVIAVLTGIVRTSVVFWLPTYLTQALHFTTDQSLVIFSAATFIIALTTFVSVFVYERLKRNMDLTVLVMFSASTVFFALTYLVKQPIANVCFLVLAIMASGGAAAMMFSRYCPGLRDTGMVSSVTGFLDFLSYMAAALANVLFAEAATSIGWDNLILIWLGMMVIGVAISLPYKSFRHKKA